MKRCIEVITKKRYSCLLSRLVLAIQCLGFSHIPTVGSIWTEALDGDGLGRFSVDTLFHGLIAGNRPELNRYKRSGGCWHLAMLST